MRALTVRLAATGGLLAGVLEALVRLARKELFGKPLDLGWHVTWMPAAANLVLCVAAGAVLALLGRRWPALVRPPVVAGLFAGVAAYDVLLVFAPGFSGYASAAIAVGLGVQLGRALAERPGAAERFAGGALPALLVLVVAAPLGIFAAEAWRERRALARLPRAEAGRPNVLLLVMDTVRRMNLGSYGYYRATSPQIGALAAAGTRFTQAVSAAPWTLPSHATMFTGRWHHELSTDWFTPLDGTYPTLAERLAARGYSTGGFVANISYCDREWGLDRGFAHYRGLLLTPGQVLRASTVGRWVADLGPVAAALPPAEGQWVRKPADRVNAEFLDWLDGVGERPFFAFLNYFDAHRPYLPGPAFAGTFRADVPDTSGGRTLPFDVQDRAWEMRQYDRSIATIDAAIGELVSELRRRGQLERTLIVVTSDHGEEFAEHGIVGHGSTLYYPSLAVPLVVVLPGFAPAGVMVTVPVSLRDLAATVLDAAGAPPGALPGRSLARFWGNPAAAPDTLLAEVNRAPGHAPSVPVSQGDLRSALAGRHQLIEYGDRRRELFDLTADPWSMADLTADTAYAAVREALGTVVDRVPRRP